MKVILLADIKSLGRRGDIKEVADGYARNYLIPKRLAQSADKGNLNIVEHEKFLKIKAEEKQLADATAIAEKLDNRTLTVKANVGEGGKLFGSVTTGDIASTLAEQGINIDKRKIEISEPIKSVGSHQIAIKLHPQVQISITIEVKPQD